MGIIDNIKKAFSSDAATHQVQPGPTEAKPLPESFSIDTLEADRAEKDRFFRSSPHSPISDRTNFTGLNYYPHLEHLSSLLHPEKVIIGNGPYSVGILKYIDAIMAEAQDWICEHLQYLSLAKPMFFLVYETSDSAIINPFFY